MELANSTNQYPFLRGGGEMGGLIRHYDWSNTSLGTPDQWPQSLRTIVGILLHSKFPMFLFWGPELVCFYNDAYRPSLGNDGKHPTALGGRGEIVWAETWPIIKPLIDQVLAGGEASWSEDQLIPIYRNGQLEDVYWTFSYSPAYGDQGEIAGVFVTCTETTKNVLARQKAEETQRQLLTSFEASPIAIAIISQENLVFQMANSFYGHLVGRRPEAILGKSLLEALPELAGQGFDNLLRQVIETGKPYIANEVSVDIVRHNQLETIYVDLTYQPQREADGSISGILVVAIDVTQQVRNRTVIQESEAKLKALVAAAPVAIGLFMGRDLVVELPNQTFIDIVGKGPDIAGKPLREVMPELLTENQPFLNILDQVYTSGKMYQSFGARVSIVQQGVMTHNYYNITYTPLFNEAGDVYAILDIAVDVTGQILIQQEMARQKTYLQNALDIAELGTYRIDLINGIGSYTENIRQWFALDSLSESIETIFSKVHPDDQDLIRNTLSLSQHPTGQNSHDVTYRIVDANGQTTHYLRSMGKIEYVDDQAYAITGVIQDVTSQRLARRAVEESEARYRALSEALELQVQQRTEELATANEELAASNEELEANNEEYASINEELEEANGLLLRSNENLQQFAYVASHDLQEPLRKIQQFGDLLKSRYTAPTGEELDYLDRMQSAANRMSILIRDLLNFSRLSTQRETSDSVSLNEIVRSVLAELDLRIQESAASIQVDLLPTLEGDSMQLEQLFQNLISNALKFHQPDRSPVIRITARRVDASDLPPAVKPARLSRQYHRIDVSDNGIGFDEKYQDRIFQVFQRLHNRSVFAGTGIGLAICKRVAVNHGGDITASSEPGRGATFSIYLPV